MNLCRPIMLLQATPATAGGTEGFLPHGFCFLWNQPLLWTHVVSDIVIGLSYVTISFSLAWLVHKLRRDIPFSVVFIAFGLFIITCGLTHLFEVWTFWNPVYWELGIVKVVTAVASVSTAIALPFVIPQVRTTVSEAKLSRERAIAAERAAVLEAANRELEEARQRAEEANRAKSEFLAVMSHELRTPLNAVIGYAELMAMGIGGAVTDVQREQLERIRGSSLHLVGLIDQVLQFARIDAGREVLRISHFDVVEIAREAVALMEPLAMRRSLALRTDLPDVAVEMQSDPGKIRQIVLNLLSNAVKYTASGAVEVTLGAVADQTVIRVQDTGIGIAADDMDRIFDPFWQGQRGTTREIGGTGLGLSVTRHLVTLLGGTIEVRSTPGVGSTFEIRLPLAAPAQHAEAA